jgi:hypothetical protein
VTPEQVAPFYSCVVYGSSFCLKIPFCPVFIQNGGRAIAQAVSRWLPTAAARVGARVWSCGICGGQIGTGADVLRVLRFPLPIFIPPNSPSSQSPGAGTIVADMPSGLTSTPHYAIYSE